jgi:hypothetical protein
MLYSEKEKKRKKPTAHTWRLRKKQQKYKRNETRKEKRKEGQATRGWCSLLTILFEKKHFISALIMSTPNTLKVLHLVDINYNSECELVGWGKGIP